MDRSIIEDRYDGIIVWAEGDTPIEATEREGDLSHELRSLVADVGRLDYDDEATVGVIVAELHDLIRRHVTDRLAGLDLAAVA